MPAPPKSDAVAVPVGLKRTNCNPWLELSCKFGLQRLTHVVASLINYESFDARSRNGFLPAAMPSRHEVWVRSNSRAMIIGLTAPLLLVILGLAIALDWTGESQPWRPIVGFGLASVGGLLTLVLGWFSRLPRLAYDGEALLVYLRSGVPIRVPIDAVECFFLGAGLVPLPGHANREVQISTLVVRLAERATDWHSMEVKPALGAWCGGYITLRGTWCEPLSVDFVNRLNARLSAVQRERTTASVTPQ